MLNKRIASEFAIGIILLVAISVAGVFLLQDSRRDVSDYIESVNLKQPVKNISNNNESVVIKEAQQVIGENNDELACANHTYSGEQKLRGAYVLSTLPNSEKKEWLFKVVVEDLAKLPALATREENFSGSIFVVDVTPDMTAKLKKATEEKPETLTIKRIYLDCSGVPIASLESSKDAIAKYIK